MVTLRAHWPPTKTQTKPQLVNDTQAGSANQTHTKNSIELSFFFFFLLLVAKMNRTLTLNESRARLSPHADMDTCTKGCVEEQTRPVPSAPGASLQRSGAAIFIHQDHSVNTACVRSCMATSTHTRAHAPTHHTHPSGVNIHSNRSATKLTKAAGTDGKSHLKQEDKRR